MNLYKLKVSGDDDAFTIQYNFSNNFLDYKECNFIGSEQEKYSQFLEDLKKNGGAQPINIKVKMSNKSVDRAMAKSKIITIKEVNELIKKLGQ
jgi:hypothetical protein